LPSSIQQFSAVGSSKEFRDIVGDQNRKVISEPERRPSSHFIHPQVFIDIEGKREWEASDLGHKLITLCAKSGEDEEDDNNDKDDEDDQEEEEGTRTINGMHQVLTFLWAAAKQCGKPMTLREIPEEETVTSLCEKKTLTMTVGRPSATGAGQTMNHGAALLESQRLTDAMVWNLNKSSEARVLQINKDDSTKSALSRLMAPDQASSLFHLLTADSFEMDGVPELNEFTMKLTKGQDPMRVVNMVQQAT
jgi:hypothetical protein